MENTLYTVVMDIAHYCLCIAYAIRVSIAAFFLLELGKGGGEGVFSHMKPTVK